MKWKFKNEIYHDFSQKFKNCVIFLKFSYVLYVPHVRTSDLGQMKQCG
jgi:hypothetical protein